MRYDNKVYFRIESKVQTDMGGWIVKEIDGNSFDAYATPVKVDVLLRDYGITSNSAYKIITREQVDIHESLLLRDDKYRYKILQVLDLKLKIFLVEKVGDYVEN